MVVSKFEFSCWSIVLLISVSYSQNDALPTPKPSVNETGSVKCTRYHQVVTGENPFTIALEESTTPEKLQYLTPSMDVHDLQSGQRICVEADIYPPDHNSACENGCPTAKPPHDALRGSIDPIAEKCGDFYMLYGYEPDLPLPTACANQIVKNRFKKYAEENVGLVQRTRDAWRMRTRDGWRINCANRYYITLCYQ